MLNSVYGISYYWCSFHFFLIVGTFIWFANVSKVKGTELKKKKIKEFNVATQ